MKTDSGLLLLRTSVRPQIEKKVLVRGCMTIGVSVLLIWAVELILPTIGIESIGMWRWLAGSGALGAGYLPYKKLLQQKKHPEILQANDHEVILLRDKEKVFSISWNEIESFAFLDKGSIYGLAFTLKTPISVIESLLPEQAKDEFGSFKDNLEQFSQANKKKYSNLYTELPLSPYKSSQLPQFLIQKNKKEYGVDIFLPFFSQNSYQLLQQWHDQNIQK